MTKNLSGLEVESPTLITRRAVIAGIFSTLAVPTILAKAYAQQQPRPTPARPVKTVKPLPREHHTTTETPQGSLVVGGYYLGALSTVHLFDGSKWHNAPPMLTPRYKHVAVPYGNGVLVIGGLSSSGQPMSDAELFDGTKWRKVAPMKIARSQHAGILWNGSVLVTGGIGIQPLSAVEMFDGTTWRPAQHMRSPRYGHSVAIGDGAAIVTGGFNLGPLSNSERFNGQEWTVIKP